MDEESPTIRPNGLSTSLRLTTRTDVARLATAKPRGEKNSSSPASTLTFTSDVGATSYLYHALEPHGVTNFT
jgi:hypothetical protein